MSKYSRLGGKFTNTHTTLIPLACVACDILKKCEYVSKISPGIIKAGLKSVKGKRRIKVGAEGGKHILLSIRDNTSLQEVHVYSNDFEKTKAHLARRLQEKGVLINFNAPTLR